MKIKKINLWPTSFAIAFVFAGLGLFKGLLSVLPFRPFFFPMGEFAGGGITFSLGIISATVLGSFLKGLIYSVIGIIIYNLISKSLSVEYKI